MWFENWKTVGKFYYGLGCKNPATTYPIGGWVFTTSNAGTDSDPYLIKWTDQGLMIHINDDNGTSLDTDELGYDKETKMF
jgi:hypothetical protein